MAAHMLERKETLVRLDTTVSSYDAKDRKTIAEFAHAEDAAHNVAYYLADHWMPGESVDLLDADGTIRKYDVTPIAALNPGIVGFILAGQEKDNNRIHVLFRGTADKASAVRDTEYGGAGQESFHAEEDLILSQIIKVVGERVSNTDTKQQITFSGHSLGGADAQNCAAAFIEAATRVHAHKRYQEKDLIGKAAARIKSALTTRPSGRVACDSHAPLLMVDAIRVNHVNSAGVPYHSHKRSVDNAKRLAKWGVKLDVRALTASGDGVQLSGQTSILHDVDHEVANVQVFKVDSGHEGWFGPKMLTAAAAASLVAPATAVVGGLSAAALYGTKVAHTKHNFQKVLKKEEYEHHCNSTPEGATTVKRRLSKKTMFFDNNPVAHVVKKFTNTVTSQFVANRKVAPHHIEHAETVKREKAMLAQYHMYEMLRTDDLLHNEKLLNELIVENRTTVGLRAN